MMLTIQIRERHLTSPEVLTECRAAHGQREISDAAAVSIAAWYQAPRGTGSVLASLASGCRVDRGALCDDISDTIAEHYATASPDDRLTLDMLGTWALHVTTDES